MTPNFPEFKTLEIQDKSWIEEITEKFPPYSDHHYTGLFSYDINNAVQVCCLNDNFVMRSFDYIDGKPFFSFLGNSKVIETAEILFDFMKNEGMDQVLKLIPEHTILVEEDKFFQNYLINEDRDNFDYLISTRHMANIVNTGCSYGRHIRKFIADYPDIQTKVLDPLDNNILNKVYNLFEKWEIEKGLKREDTETEYKALKKLLEYAPYFSLHNLGLFLSNELIGFTINELSYNHTYIGHFGKAAGDYRGIYQYMEYACACKMLEMGYETFNNEQDLGLPGLRKTKMSWGDTTFLKKYSVRRTQPNEDKLYSVN